MVASWASWFIFVEKNIQRRNEDKVESKQGNGFHFQKQWAASEGHEQTSRAHRHCTVNFFLNGLFS